MSPELAGGLPSADEGYRIVAWRCEACRKLQPTGIEAKVIHIDEVRSEWHGTTVKRHSRFVRRMVVCPPCARSIAGGT